MRSQSMREDLVEFEELNEGDDFPLHALEDEGGGGGAGHEIAEQEGKLQNDQLAGGSTPKRPHSPGESPNKKSIILPENGRKIWIKNKEGIRNEYFVQSKKNKHTMNLVNSDNVKITKNLKDLSWGYIEQEHGGGL